MIIIAIDNETVFNNLKNKIQIEIKEEVYSFDIQTKEDVIDLITKLSNILNEKITLITKENLTSSGLNIEMYIKKLKFINNDIKIIFNTDVLSNATKTILYSNEIFTIVEDENFNIDKIISYLHNEKVNTVKMLSNNNMLNNNTTNDNILNKNKEVLSIENEGINTKNFIAVFGTSGSGKSYISNAIASSIVKEYSLKTCLVDMDFENSSIDILNNITNNEEGISSIVSQIDLDKNITNIINNAVVTKNKLDYIINNTSIYDYKNKINTEHYLKIYNELNKRYQTVIVDLPAFPFIDVVSFTLNYATKVIFVINPNYASLRQAVKYLELINKYFNISKNCINIVVNKVTNDSLKMDIIKNILEGYNIIISVDFNKNLESNINNNIFNLTESIDVLPIVLNEDEINYEYTNKNKNKSLFINNIFKIMNVNSLFERKS